MSFLKCVEGWESVIQKDPQMKRDRELQIRMLRELRGDGKDDYGDIPDEVRGYNAALLIEEGLVDGIKRRTTKGGYGAAIFHGLTVKGHDFLDRLDASVGMASSSSTTPLTAMKIFISHASADCQVAEALAKLLRTAFNLSSDEIRCTSVDDFRLPVGADTDEQLKNEVRDSKAFVGIITPSSIQSAYVLFELGARWGAGLPLFPVLARGAGSKHLKGPLGGINALSISSAAQVRRLLEDMGQLPDFSLERMSVLEDGVAAVVTCALTVEESASQQSPSNGQPILDETKTKILQWLFETERWKSKADVAEQFSLHGSLALHCLESLLEQDLVNFRRGRPFPDIRTTREDRGMADTFQISRKGRDYIAKTAQ